MPADHPPAEPVVDPSPASPARQPRRRWLRYSLRTLLMVMFLCGLAAGWVGMLVQVGREQLAAIAWVEAQGGEVQYAEPTKPLWQQRWLGDWYPDPVVLVDLGDLEVDNLSPLGEFKGLRVALLRGTAARDLAPLSELELLVFVDLSETGFVESQIAQLQNTLPELRIWREDIEKAESPRISVRQRKFSYQAGDERLWTLTLPQHVSLPIQYDYPIEVLNRAYLTNYSQIVALDLKEGKIAWTCDLSNAMLRACGDLLLVIPYVSEEDAATRDYWAIALSTATGEEVFRLELPPDKSRWDLHSVDGFFTLGFEDQFLKGQTDCDIYDQKGKLRYRSPDGCRAIHQVDEDLVILTEQRFVRVTPDGEVKWSLSVTHPAELGKAEFKELVGGDLIVQYFQWVYGDVHVLRIDPATGTAQWTAICPGTSSSFSSGLQVSSLGLRGDVIVVKNIGTVERILQLINVQDGRSLLLHRSGDPHAW